jgi:hypothetical protein
VKRLGDDKALGYASQATIDTGVLNLDATEFDMDLRARRLPRALDRIHIARRPRPGNRQHFAPLCPINPAVPPSHQGDRRPRRPRGGAFAIAQYLRPTARVETVVSGEAVDAKPGSVTVKEEYAMQMKSEPSPGACSARTTSSIPGSR